MLIKKQLKEIGGRSKPSDSLKPTEQPAEKKKGLADWMNVIKPGNEEKDHWVTYFKIIYFSEEIEKCLVYCRFLMHHTFKL